MNKKKRTRKPKRSSTRNPFEKPILDFLKAHDKENFRRKEISHKLNVSKKDYHLFREALDNLVQSDQILKLKGHTYASLAAQRMVEGALQMTRKGFAFVTDEQAGEDIFIPASGINTAMDGDIVEVRLYAHSRGRSKEGRVNRIIERARTQFVGTYKKSKYYGFVVPDSPKLHRDFYIHDDLVGGAKNGQKVLVELIKWDRSQLNPEGKVVEVLGFPGEPGVDVASVAMGHGLAMQFPEEVEKAAKSKKLDLSPKELAKRLDLRDMAVFTIDPPDAKDFDDAVSLEELPNGHVKLGVHIADVAHYVPEGSDLDQSALERGTSVYLVDRVIPMLPEHLSNELCSLQPNVDRLAYTCIMEFDKDLDLVDYTLAKSVINSKRRYTYREVQDIIDAEGKSRDPHAKTIAAMHAFSRKVRERRSAQGSIDFDTPEVKFTLDEKGQPIEIIPVERLHSNEMIEEFMLLANQTVTKHIYRIADGKRPYPFIYRVHEKPDAEKLQKFRLFLKALGYKIPVRKGITPKDFQAILDQIAGTKDEPLVREVALRTMMKAIYSPKNTGHFGLAFEYYTHFTSPIRRYPDLVVHRLLKEYEQTPSKKRLQDLNKRLPVICQKTSLRERQALEAERDSIRLKQVEWMTRHRGEVFEGLISGVTAFGIFVETIPWLVEGLIGMDRLNDDFYIFDEKTYSMIGKDTGRVLRLGDPVKVRVAEVNLERREIDFELVDEEKRKAGK